MMTDQERAINAEFHYQMVLDPNESRRAGRPIFNDQLYIRLQPKGQASTVVDRAVKDQDRFDYPNAWAKWELLNEKPADGLPLSYLPGITPSSDHYFRSMGIRTLEGVAALSAEKLVSLRDGLALQTRAKAYITAMVAAPIAGDVLIDPEELPVKKPKAGLKDIRN